MYSRVKLKAVRDPDLSLIHIQRMMRTIFINHSERLSVTKKNPESKMYQEPNRRGRENGRESAMSTAFITTCHDCKKPGHKVKDCKKLEREYEMEKSGKLNHEREKKWCSYHQTRSFLLNPKYNDTLPLCMKIREAKDSNGPGDMWGTTVRNKMEDEELTTFWESSGISYGGLHEVVVRPT